MLSFLSFLALTALGMAALGSTSTSRRPRDLGLRATLAEFARHHALWLDDDIDFRGRARVVGTVHGARTQILYGDVLDTHGSRQPTLTFRAELPHDLVTVPELLVEPSSDGRLVAQRAHAAWRALADPRITAALGALHDVLANRGGAICFEGGAVNVSMHLHPGELELSDVIVAPVLEASADLVDALSDAWRAVPERLLDIVGDHAIALELRAHAAKLLFTRFATTPSARDAAHLSLDDPALRHVCLTWSAEPVVFARYITDGGSLDAMRSRRLKAIQRAEFASDTLALGTALLEIFSPDLILSTEHESARARLVAALLHTRRAPWAAWLATAIGHGHIFGHTLISAADVARTPIPAPILAMLVRAHAVQDRHRVLALVALHYDEDVERALLAAIDPTWTPEDLEVTAAILARRGTPRALEPLHELQRELSWVHPISRLKLRSAISIIHRRALRQEHHAPGALSLSSSDDEHGRLSLSDSKHGDLELSDELST